MALIRPGTNQIYGLPTKGQSHGNPPSPGGNGGGDWILALNTWNDSGVWDDAATWND